MGKFKALRVSYYEHTTRFFYDIYKRIRSLMIYIEYVYDNYANLSNII